MIKTLALLMLTTLLTTHAEHVRVYFGSGTTSEGEGIFSSLLDLNTGKLSEPSLAAEAVRPGYIALHPDGTHLYSIGNPGGYTGSRSGSVCAFKIDPKTGALEFLNTQTSQGTGPCFITVDPSGRTVLVAYYQSGSCATFPLETDGSLKAASSFHQHAGSSLHPTRQTAPHPHAIVLDAAGRYAFVPDLGLDQILIYTFDAATGALTPHNPPFVTIKPGSGPRHLVFHPSGKWAYASLELTSEAAAFHYDSKSGTLVEFQTISALPNDFSGANTTAGVCTTPDGRFLYISNRGHNSIAQFSIDPDSGRLTSSGNQSTQTLLPRGIQIDPSGRVLVATDKKSGSVSAFKIDRNTGQLTPSGSIHIPKAGSPLFHSLD